MKTDAQRIAIAEACGWKYWQSKHGHYNVISPTGDKFSPGYGWPEYDESTGMKITRHWTDGVDIPDYLNDLNAMHEAEKGLTEEQRRQYVRMLFQTTNTDWDSHCATAAQRAEAFLKTIGKWTD